MKTTDRPDPGTELKVVLREDQILGLEALHCGLPTSFAAAAFDQAARSSNCRRRRVFLVTVVVKEIEKEVVESPNL